MHPEYLYWTLVALVAWPCCLFSRCSAVLTATWAVGQLCYVAGLPEAKVQLVLYALAFAVTIRLAWGGWCRAVAALYAALFLVCFIWWDGPATAQTWWSIYWLAMVQICLIPFTVDWDRANQTWLAFRERRDMNDFMRVLVRQVHAW